MWRKYWSGNTKKNIMSSLLVTKDEIINNTILYLISHNYVKGELINGEWDIIPLDEEK